LVEAVSSRFVTAEAWVQFKDSPYGICDGKHEVKGKVLSLLN
jgi:hypothetical protein